MKVKVFDKKLKPTKLFPKGRTALYLDFYHKGVRKFESLNLYIYPGMGKSERERIREVAEKTRIKREAAFMQNEFDVPLEIAQNKDFISYLESFIEEKKRKGISYNTYHGVYKKIKQYHKGKLTFKMITPAWLNGYFNHLRTVLKSQNTQNAYANKLSAVLHQAVKDNYLNRNPITLIDKPKKEHVQKVYLLEEEIKKLIDTPCKQNDLKLAFLFSCFSGLRFGDIKKLTWNNVKNNRIEIRQEKTSQPVYLDLSKTAIEILTKKYELDTKENIMPMPNRKVFKLPGSKRNDIIREWAKSAGLSEDRWKKSDITRSHLTFHSARHTYATLAITQGIDIYTVSSLLGHTNVKTTLDYAKIIDEKRKKELDKLPVFSEFA